MRGSSSKKPIYALRESQKKKKREMARIPEEIIAKNFPNLMRDMSLHVQKLNELQVG